MTKRIVALALFGGLLTLAAAGHAQDKSAPPAAKQDKAGQPAAKPQRTLYAVQNGDPAVLAEVLNKHFRGEAEVLAVPAGSGNALLISGAPAATAEVVKLLGELDRKPKTVEVEVILAEVPTRKADGKEAVDADFSGPDVLTKLEAMGKAGQTGPIQRIKLTAVEGQPVASTTGGNKPYTSGAAAAGGFGGKGGGGRSVSYQPVGTTIRMTARVGAGDAVMVDLNLSDSQVKLAEAGDDSGAPTFDNSTLATKLTVAPNRPVVAQAVRVEAKSSRSVTLVIVTARVVDPLAAGNKQ